jgi:hypothetical protein
LGPAGEGQIDVCHTKHTAAYGAEDDQIIVLLYDSYRSGQPTGKCNKEDKSGCLEVFISESYDDGKTWSKPTILPRPHSDDVVNRVKPATVYDREQNVIYITYSYQNLETGVNTIAFVKKVMKVGKYTEETLLELPGPFKGAKGAKLTITNPKKKSGILHMAVVGLLGGAKTSVYYLKSLDQGKTWALKTEFTPGDELGVHHVSLTSVGGAGNSDIFVAYNNHNFNDIEFRYSPDAGETWGKIVKVNKIARLLPYIRPCGQTKTLGVLFSSYSYPLRKMETLYYNHTSGIIQTLPNPFKGLGEMTHVPCGECVGLADPDVKFIIGAGRQADQTFYFDTYNYDYPEVSA